MTLDASTTSPRILFIHIPKTGGMSLYAALQRWAGASSSVRFALGGAQDIEAYMALPSLDGLSLIAGHLGYASLSRRDIRGWNLITVVRDPVERALSYFSYLRSNRSHPRHKAVRSMDIGQFLETLEPHELNQQCRMIGGSPFAAEAIARIERDYSLVGTTDHLDVFARTLAGHLGVELAVGVENRTQHKIDLDRRARDQIAQSNAEDVLLVRYVADRTLINPRWRA